MDNTTRLRWLVVAVIVLSSALNYLDRLVLAALAPAIRGEFALTARDYGYVLTAFSVVYALGSPAMGWLIDRFGLAAGAAVAVALWSAAGTATGAVTSFATLLLCRGALGFAESGGVPATGKAFATYLEPKDRAVGTALNQVGLTIGSAAAPLLAAWAVASYNWRFAFVVSGLLGFLWIPVWLLAARRASPVSVPPAVATVRSGDILRDQRFLLLIAANMVAMTVYSLWSNWTTLFLVTQHRLTPNDANQHYAWIPPIAATAGGLFGGWLARRMIQSGRDVRTARLGAGLLGGVVVLPMALAPFVASPAVSVAAIAAGFFGVTCQSVNYYAIPLDLFGPSRAAFAVSWLTGSFGLMQAFLSPLIGDWSERFGWQPVCVVVAVLPLVSVAVARHSLREPSAPR